ncbi:MAG: T9SS type A sorting domain-containing protein [Bacteroidota bacterium]
MTTFYLRPRNKGILWGQFLNSLLILFLLIPFSLSAQVSWSAIDDTNGLPTNDVRGVAADGMNIYVATAAGLAISTDGGASFATKTTADGLGSDNTNDVFLDGSDIYVATSLGLSVSTDGGNSFTNFTPGTFPFANNMSDVFVEGGTIYLTSFARFFFSTDGGATFEERTSADGLGADFYRGVAASGSTVYVAADGGLSISTDGGDTFINKTSADGLANTGVDGIAIDGGTVYTASEGFAPVGGLSITDDMGASFTVIQQATSFAGPGPFDGLRANSVNNVDVDGSTIIVGTSGSSVSISYDGGTSFFHYDFNDGIIGITRDSYIDGNTFYVATNQGLAVGVDGNTAMDTDGDGVNDDVDNCPAIANADQTDTDSDGDGDACDEDDDNDGVNDADDAFPLDATESSDNDEDGIGDNADTDDDNDGVDDADDAFPLDPAESSDNDEDGIGDNADTDDDNDGQSDADEAACGSDPLDAASTSADNDSDGSPDCVDLDDDNDGVNDDVDNCPVNANADQADADGNGIGDACDTPAPSDGVLNFSLINTVTNMPVAGFDPIPEGANIDLSTFGNTPADFNIRANTMGTNIDQVILDLSRSGRTFRRIENNAPYALFGNSGNNYFNPDFRFLFFVLRTNGVFSLSATPRDSRGNVAGNVALLNFTLSVGNNQLRVFSEEKTLNVYPNPSNGQVVLNGDLAIEGKATLRILNAMGQEVYAEEVSANFMQRVDLSSMAKGLYIVKLESGEASLQRKLIIE